MTAAPLLREYRTTYWKIVIVGGLMVALYAHVLADLAHDWWTDPDVSQGMLILPLAIVIAWSRRRLTMAEPVEPGGRGLALVALACVFYLLGRLGAEFFLPRISFVMLLAGLAWTFWGRKRLRTLGFPLLLMATMVPLPALIYNAAAAPLQLFASDIATRLAQAAGIAVYRDGNIIHLAKISLGVAEACSGLHSLSALMVGSILVGFLQCSRALTRWILFLISFPLAIAANIFRITGTAIMADFHQELAMGFYHLFSGWLVFIFGFGLLYLGAGALRALLERGAVNPESASRHRRGA